MDSELRGQVQLSEVLECSGDFVRISMPNPVRFVNVDLPYCSGRLRDVKIKPGIISIPGLILLYLMIFILPEESDVMGDRKRMCQGPLGR